MDLSTQKRLAADILKVGVNRVWIDPDRVDEVARAITRESIKKLIKEGAIKAKQKKGISRYRARKIAMQKKKGRRRGKGSIKGAKGARMPKKRAWISRIRALRRTLKELRDKRKISTKTYRKIYRMAKGGMFRSKAHMNAYIKEHGLLRR
ncbi:LSU ribosomal protein L19E [Methanothermus fervidus DSM 2088]|uniref:Large ribosomal subunit protein eL19 n=1 Tax=Methanothermus fervidus (strain ATCC 43054 / DSM 2088 / JCM 10308 / V24 S) TaxID=523846 RepID=E3GZD7_METFV|nr:50S ribosomal protein L19e [Methanothermus fervidus]ADP77669.1 LSU ribosomal protein L19E [Methanothermus fervidus DSM 2088]